ncbi:MULTISPECIES: hypothetical protein [Brevibacillus]|uniref:hypothetical protein n=1 Tax=Brevibacillus TaxID=55080 RepID=UPI001F3CBDA0|nr:MULTISPECIES: hypothetical protein [Brevibacillus]
MDSKRFVTFQDYISHYAIDMDYLKKGCDRPEDWDKYNQAEIFYDTDKEIKEQQSYLELERKFLNVFGKAW